MPKQSEVNKVKKENEKNEETLTPDEKMKYEIAKELGLFEQVEAHGWKSLTAKEAGRIGGIMTKRKKAMKKASTLPKDSH